MTTTQILTTEIANGKKYISTVYRGTEYTTVAGPYGWNVYTRRLGYGGRTHMGSTKVFATLAAMQANCKAFAGLDLTAAL